MTALDGSPPKGEPDSARRRAAHLYGLVVTGSVLAAAPLELGLVRIALLLLGTLAVYWAAESYAHMIAARTVLRRSMTAHERREVFRDGVPLIAACLIPGVVLVGEAVLGVDVGTGIDIALGVNLAMLLVVGWRMSSVSGMTGLTRIGSTLLCGLLGVALAALKMGLHH
ncbi:hypothetical protein [Cellulomonas sp. PhB150]|uniref:hypothetical protein n=1 Tax=Cellulomonas sp. PhB150 TaxID=2485188 RepID=UPI000F469F7A|nr:hypothetical protein [Cellulomonas sp. PhB150]ROS27881.1 hypothetical protein EDF34_1674 [Cellulomonas sp. PhB150]